jgi:glycine/D-amino acid oxidase-like deaminating enzyme
VLGIKVLPNSVEVRTPDATYSGAKLILVPGSWGNVLFEKVGLHLPLTPMRAQEQYFDAQPIRDYEPDRFPIFIARMNSIYPWVPYGLPSVDGSGLKVGLHGGPVIDNLDTLERVPDPSMVGTARQFMRDHIPGGDAPLKYARVCLYTWTPDEHFVIDKHPEHPHVIISASCSGHAFKFSNILGSFLADLAIKGTTEHDIHLFRMERFGTVEIQ